MCICVFRVKQVGVVARTVSNEVRMVANAEKTKKMRGRKEGRTIGKKKSKRRNVFSIRSIWSCIPPEIS